MTAPRTEIEAAARRLSVARLALRSAVQARANGDGLAISCMEHELTCAVMECLALGLPIDAVHDEQGRRIA